MYKEYFNNMFKDIDPNIVLDEEQIKAITSDDKYALVLAGAGTGKTTTIGAKVKYLVDIKNIDPSRILVMSYTKKATEELRNLIIDKFSIPAYVTTFHSLGLKYIKHIFNNRKCTIVDYNEKEKIFYDYMNIIFKDKNYIKKLINIFSKDLTKEKFVFGNFFLNNYDKYNTYDEFFLAYKNLKIKEAQILGIKSIINEWINKRLNSEVIITINGELVKSASECIIANFLFKHGINYVYEKVYSEIIEDYTTYKPDFTIEYGGKLFYLEYFGINNEKYNLIKDKKITFHKEHNNNFIYLENLSLNEIEENLDKKLKELGIIYNDRTNEEIYNQILNNNKLSQLYPLKRLAYETINKIKENIDRDNYIKIVENYLNTRENLLEQETLINQFEFINNFYKYYQDRLYSTDVYGFDYSDLLYYSNKYIYNLGIDNELNFDYIIIDEYQDISQNKYLLAKNTATRSDSKIFAVGDDFQTIFSFAGSKIEYIYNFTKFFEGAKIYKINKTYRNPQELIDVAGTFIMKNENQIKKELVSNKHLDKPIKFITYNSLINGCISYEEEYKCLKKTIVNIHKIYPNHNILIIARNNNMIEKCFSDKDFIDDLDTKVKFTLYSDLSIDAMTIHKSKGLTFDEVIILGMNKSFPSSNINGFWLIDLFKNKVVEENIPYPEERRLLYVALTRTKNNVYILTDRNPNNRSLFIDELVKICKDKY